MKKWLISFGVIVIFGIISGCTKYTTPSKVSRRIINDSWTISSFTIDGQSVTSNYSGYTFAFEDGGGITVKAVAAGFSATGAWKMGLVKNPAILYLSFAPGGGLEYLADDWQVVEMQKSLMRLKRNDSGGNATVTFTK
jgi:hypothetical protein